MASKKGFTLIELSIVIVIIGLIVAGVVGGQELVKGAKLRGIIADIDKYRTAYNSFFLAYDDIPGDMTNAQDYFGSGVANGNGNGQIRDSDALAAWEHLAEAGLIEGTYTGTTDSGSYKSLGVNIPDASFAPDAGYNFQDIADFGNSIEISSNVSCNNWLNGRLLTPREAYAIDSKSDDGSPSLKKGMVYSVRGTIVGNCSPADTCLDGSDYNLDESAKACRTFFKLIK
jgi:prepilin-type N-terminal cleavage/methylation domain-containing protein